MVVHRYFARTWGLCWIITAIIASIATSSAAFSGGGLPFHQGSAFLSHHFDLSTPNLMSVEARRYVERYLFDIRTETEAVLGRTEKFFPDIERGLKEAGLPDALKYLPMVESTLQPEVVSPSGAAGLWQIMPSTARYIGLRVDGVLDERLDTQLSGRAAIRMLRELYAEFGDWSLALAAYNCGPGRMRRAIDKAQSREYSRLRFFLPAQTRAHLSKFVAMAHISQYWQKYGLKPQAELLDPVIRLKEVPAGDYLDFQEVAVQLGISVESLRRLNPGYRFGRFQGTNQYMRTLKVPEHLADKLMLHTGNTKKSGSSLENYRLQRSFFVEGKNRGVGGAIWQMVTFKKEIGEHYFAELQEVLQRDGLVGALDGFFFKYLSNA